MIRTVRLVAGRWAWAVHRRDTGSPVATCATMFDTWVAAASDCYLSVPGEEDVLVSLPRVDVEALP